MEFVGTAAQKGERMALTATHHELTGGYQPIEGSTDRSFGLVFAAVFALLAAYLIWHDRAWWWVPLSASMAFLSLALFQPSLLAHLNWIWTTLGLLLGMVMAPILMAVIFFGVVMPIGLVMLAWWQGFSASASRSVRQELLIG